MDENIYESFITILSFDIIVMDRKVENLLRILQEIRRSNDVQLAKRFSNMPLHLNQLITLKKEIVKKDQEWLNSVIESLRLFCLRSFLDKRVIHTNIKKEFTSLIINDEIQRTADGLNRILLFIWKMHGNKIYNNQMNANRALQAEESMAQRNEQFSNVLTNIGNPNDWNEAPTNIHNKAAREHALKERQKKIDQNREDKEEYAQYLIDRQKNLDQNIANHDRLNKLIGNAVNQSRKHKSDYETRRAMFRAFNADSSKKRSARRIRFKNEMPEKISGPKEVSSTLKQRNNVNTGIMMGNEYVPQIATIKKGGRKTHRTRKQ